MELLKLLIVFLVVIGLVSAKRSVSTAAVAGALVCWILFGISISDGGAIIFNTITSVDTISMMLVMYSITFMQRMMQHKDAINTARDGLTSLFRSRWVNCARAPMFVGLLPAPNAVLIAGDIVEASASEYLSKEELAVTTSFFRHTSEAFLPTYQNIILALALTGISAGSFVLGMLPLVAIIVVLGMLFFLRGKVPNKVEGLEPSANKMDDVKKIARLWPILAAIVIIVAFNMNTNLAVFLVIVAYFFVGRFKFNEITPFFVSAFEKNIMLNTVAIYIFKNFLTRSGAIDLLPGFFAKLPIPTFLVYVIIFLVGTVAANSLTMTAAVLPLAMASVPNAGLPLVCLLMAVSYVAMQISPTHICLTIVSEHFGVSFGSMVKRTVPLLCVFTVIAVFYYLGWTMLLG